jgi:hypothetical protein
LLRPKILTLSVSNPGAKHPQKATFGHGWFKWIRLCPKGD